MRLHIARQAQCSTEDGLVSEFEVSDNALPRE
jgi:hypothetical protein